VPGLDPVLWGYLVTEIPLPSPTMKEYVSITVSQVMPRNKPVQTYSGVGDPNVAAPRPDLTSTIALVACAGGRLFKETPTPDEGELRKLRNFARRYCEVKFRHLSEYDIQDTVAWVNSRKRPGSWKRKLLRTLERYGGDVWSKAFQQEMSRIQGHVKDETYPEFKYPRGINARVDENKLLFGPLISAMEEIVYEDPHFIKHIPAAERPAYIGERLSHFSQFICTDFSSFEGSFTREVTNSLERVFLDHMMSKLSPALKEKYAKAFAVCYGEKVLNYVGVDLACEALRMSGEMWTSLCNGVSNLIVQEYIMSEMGVPCEGVVEGDDGLFGFTYGTPLPDSEMYAKIGFSIKIIVTDDLNSASFCGIVFDVSKNVNITDPRDFLAGIAWLPYRYRQYRPSKKFALLNAKALSFHHQYPGCPVLEAATWNVLRITKSRNRADLDWVFEKSGFFNAYEEEDFANAWCQMDLTRHPVAFTTRVLMQESFGIDIATQIRLERWFDDWDGVAPFPQFVLSLFCSDWTSFPSNWGDNSFGRVQFVGPGPHPDRPKLEDWPIVHFRSGEVERDFVGCIG